MQINYGNLNLSVSLLIFEKLLLALLFEYIASQIHEKVKIFFVIHLFLFFSLPLFCQISWDFETPIDVADNSFGNSSANILIDEDGNPQVVVGKPNIGLYFIKSSSINFIPSGKKFDITDLIKILKKNNKEIGLYPVASDSWSDIGQYSTYKKALLKLQK